MEEQIKYGQLLNQNIKLHRQWFREMVKLNGIYVLYRAPKENKHWTTYAELETNYQPPILVGCIFNDHPDQQTMRKAGWVAELSESASIISVDYDLPDLQIGALFIVPSGLDNAQGRLFRVSKMQTSMIYPSSVTCEIVPEYEDTETGEADFDYTDTSFSLLNDEEEKFYR